MYLTPPLKGFPLELGTDAKGQKTKMMGLPDGQKKFKDNFNRLDTITGCDRQADRQTPHDSKDRAMQSVARVKIPAELYFGDIRHPHLN